jgi:hypothetical protein
MAYELTEHARESLDKRNIDLAWVERAINTPEAMKRTRWTRI